MAKMIPPQFDASTTSAAEKRIFHLFEADPATLDWFVLHSLGLSKRKNGPYGEIDFVILIPSGGVVCLEVKGGRVSCQDGLWYTTDRFGVTNELKKSPFTQARDGMFALFRAVQEKFGITSEAGSCLFASAVVFPDIECPPQTPEFHAWEAIDRSALSRTPISKLILNVLFGKRKNLHGSDSPASPSAIREIRQFLRPDFDRIVTRPTVVKECEASLIALTEDQYGVLDMISANPRCLVEGAAGTGKTVLALEYARRKASAGQKVLLLCFNRLLGEWFESCATKLKATNLTSSSYFRFVREAIVRSVWSSEFQDAEQSATQSRLFSELFPLYGLLAAESLNTQYDVVVIDEAQDLLNPDTVALLGTLLKGGMAGGNWYMFGDFTRQCIHGNSSRDACLQALTAVSPTFSHAKLQTNCRNTRRIGEETALLSGFESPPYKLGQVDGLPVDYRYWKTPRHQLERLSEIIQQLVSEGIDLRDVVLLSSRKFVDSVASQLSCETKSNGVISAVEIRTGAAPLAKAAKVGFATIQAFKGMESSVSILCDIQQVQHDEPQAVLYTGMSRARSLLIMLVHESVREAIAVSLMRRLDQGWKS